MKIYADKNSPRANGEGWHTDVSCDEEPPMGSILYIKQCPPRGGDTLFASMYAAYESLSDRMKAYLDGLTALHDGELAYRGLYANYGVADKPSLSARGASGGAHASGDGPQGALRQPRLHLATSSACRATRATRSWRISISTARTRCSSAASAGPRTRSRSGTIAAPSTARCGTTGRTPARARASP